MGREDLRESGEDLRTLGQRIGQLSEELSLLAQAYRNLFERLRLSQNSEEPGPSRGRQGPGPPPRSTSRVRQHTPAPPVSAANVGAQGSGEAELTSVRRALQALLERQGELGGRLHALARHPLFLAGGEEPRRIRSRLSELAEKCQNLRLSADALVRRDGRAVSGVLDDLCELNSAASEDLIRFGQSLRSRGDGILAGRKEDQRYLRGDAWRRASG